jgi:molybdate transport system substrate-binding protein
LKSALVAAAVAAIVSVVAACSSSSSAGGTKTSGTAVTDKLSGSIMVDAASSLTGAFDTLTSQFETAHPGTTIRLNYGASSDLSTQISQGAPVDVFASASEKNMQALGSQVVDADDFVSNTLEIAVPVGNPAHIASVTDLAKPGVKVAVCDPAVPCGVVAQKVFINAKITVRPKASLADVKSTLAAVESGEVDAGLVYVTDVRAAAGKVSGVTIPSDVNASTTYPIAVLKGAQNPALGRAFVAYVQSAAGQKVLTADGFKQP